MVGTQPATWRIVYRRAVAGKRVYGIKERDYLMFPDDLKNLNHDYVAVLECKEFDGGPWFFVAYVMVKDFANETFVLVDDKGEKFVNISLTKTFMKEFFKTKPSYNALKGINLSVF